MGFVQTNRFPLPTVTRADGTLGAYVQYNSNPRGDRFIWPAERIAIYQGQQAAKIAALKKQRAFSLLKFFGGPSATPQKRGLQTSAKLGVITTPSGPAGDVAQAVYAAGPNPTDQTAAIANAAVRILQASRDRQSSDADKQQQPDSSIISGVPNAALFIGGGLAAAGIVVALARGGRR